MRTNSPTMQDLPLDIVGSSTYGRTPKVMASRTFNMIEADGWSVGYAGFKKRKDISELGNGRGIFGSVRANRLIVVIDNTVYSISISVSLNGVKTYTLKPVGTINSFSGGVSITENVTNQVAICDQHDLYIYNTVSGAFQKADIPEGFIAGYVSYQNGRFVLTDRSSARWAVSAVGNGLNWHQGASGETVEGGLQTKPDFAIAALPVPGKGNLLYLFGKTVTEPWTDNGGTKFPYQKSFSVNVDYGVVNLDSIAVCDEMIAWFGGNEKSGPVIMYSTGADIQQLSDDGINHQLSKLVNPEDCAGFFVKLSGHLCYQLTFYDPRDNFTLLYDFSTKKFYDITDEQQNFHPARKVAFFNNSYYFISFKDGNLYEMDENFFTYDYGTFQDGSPKVYEIPRIRVTKNLRTPNSLPFIANNVTFTMEQGDDPENDGNNPDYKPRIGLSISRDGGETFGSFVSADLHKVGKRQNRIDWWKLGMANDMVLQFRFWGHGPWKATDGVVSVIQ